MNGMMSRRILLVLGSVVAVAASVYVPVLADLSADSPRVIFAPSAVSSGQRFVAALDTAGCLNRLPSVAWEAPGCVISGTGPTVSLTCTGSVGTSIQIKATASGGRPPAACNGVAATSVVIAGGSEAIPKCSAVVTAPIFTGRAQGQVGTVRLAVTECLEEPSLTCTALAGLPNGTEIAVRLAEAEASAPAELLPFVRAARSLPDSGAAFTALAQAVHCLSPAPAPSHPETVSGQEVKDWLLGTVLREGSPLSGFRVIVSNLSPSACQWAYRLGVGIKRGIRL